MRKAEGLVNHARIRKIITYLIILGNAGIVSVIASFVVFLRPTDVLRPLWLPGFSGHPKESWYKVMKEVSGESQKTED